METTETGRPVGVVSFTTQIDDNGNYKCEISITGEVEEMFTDIERNNDLILKKFERSFEHYRKLKNKETK